LGQEYPYKKHKKGLYTPSCAWLSIWAIALY